MMNKLQQTIKSPKILITAALLSLFSPTALYAHDSCDVDLKAGLTINKSKIEFFESKNKKNIFYIIDNQNNLTVHGKPISLNSEQKVLVKQYTTRIRAMVPQVRHLAIEGVELAIEGVNLAFNELLGEGNTAGVGLTKELSSIRDEVLDRYTIEKGFTLGEHGLEDDELLGKEFEQRIESAVENAVMSSMGTILVTLGQKMMLSGSDGGSFETKMESFGENVEREMEMRTEKIERKADSLCVDITEIDQLEGKLQSSIPSLADINVLTVKKVEIQDKEDKEDKRLM
jgi:hypothetical protein